MKYKPTHLKPSKQRSNKRPIFGFDIETSGDDVTDERGREYKTNDFYMCSLKGEDYIKFFYSVKDLFNELKTKRFRNSIIVATNLAFDFFGTFHNTEYIKYFKPLMPKSNLISVKVFYNRKTKEFQQKGGKGCESITFIDTGNYFRTSVEKLGEILKVQKLDKPEFLGYKPKNETEKQILEIYNERDSEISRKFTEFFFETIYKLGGSFRPTIGAVAMSLFRNKYLKDEYKIPSVENLRFQFESYRGGRTEVFQRGYFKGKYYLYDFNSLYPSVMQENEFPDPNSLMVFKQGEEYRIKEFHGISDVDLWMPYSKIPLLCSKKHKLLFVNGNISGVYTHIELRKALELGAKILKIRKQHIYTLNCRPFKDFVDDLYKLRREYQSNKSPMELVVKLILNNLYGKFGQKFWDMTDFFPVGNMTADDIYKFEDFKIIGDYISIKQSETTPASFCCPIWASYITAYARLKLYSSLEKNEPLYCDTDSVITKNILSASSELGALKLEREISELIIVKPKFYAYIHKEGTKFKLKGARLSIKTLDEFKKIINDKKIMYKKFMKIKESIIQKIPVNSVMEQTKEFSLEDDKRIWPRPFDMTQQDSEPINY